MYSIVNERFDTPPICCISINLWRHTSLWVALQFLYFLAGFYFFSVAVGGVSLSTYKYSHKTFEAHKWHLLSRSQKPGQSMRCCSACYAITRSNLTSWSCFVELWELLSKQIWTFLRPLCSIANSHLYQFGLQYGGLRALWDNYFPTFPAPVHSRSHHITFLGSIMYQIILSLRIWFFLEPHIIHYCEDWSYSTFKKKSFERFYLGTSMRLTQLRVYSAYTSLQVRPRVRHLSSDPVWQHAVGVDLNQYSCYSY